jgi:hypothetical protein
MFILYHMKANVFLYSVLVRYLTIYYMNTLFTIKGNSFFISHKQHAHQNESTIIWRERKIEIQGLILFCLLALVLRRNVSKSANDLLVWVINNQQNNKINVLLWLNFFVLGIPRQYETL